MRLSDVFLAWLVSHSDILFLLHRCKWWCLKFLKSHLEPGGVVLAHPSCLISFPLLLLLVSSLKCAVLLTYADLTKPGMCATLGWCCSAAWLGPPHSSCLGLIVNTFEWLTSFNTPSKVTSQLISISILWWVPPDSQHWTHSGYIFSMSPPAL